MPDYRNCRCLETALHILPDLYLNPGKVITLDYDPVFSYVLILDTVFIYYGVDIVFSCKISPTIV